MDGWAGHRLVRRILAGLVAGLMLSVVLWTGGLLPTLLVGAGCALVYALSRSGGRSVGRSGGGGQHGPPVRHRELLDRAEQQNRWAARGDSRGIYGPEGAELMKAVAPDPVVPPGDQLEVAEVVHSTAELENLLTEQRPCWRYAAFVSVLVIRRAGVRSRLRDARMGFGRPSGESAAGNFEVSGFFTDRLADLSELVADVDDYMCSPAFREALGDPHDERTADPAAIVQTANRLMDIHDRFLDLSERCRGVSVPADCTDLRRDFGLLTGLPLEGFHTFIEDFVVRVAESADVARYATGDVELDPVEFGVGDDHGLLTRVSSRLRRLG